jgi:hypothetical protein
MLISADIIESDSEDYYYLQGKKGYQYGIEQLNTISQFYAQGIYAVQSKSRSVNVDDINSITGYNPNNIGVYDPTQTGSGTKYSADAIDEYGNEVTYYWQGTDYPYYSASNGKYGSLSKSYANGFTWFDNVTNTWKSSAKSSSLSKITTLTSSSYAYYPCSLSLSSSGSVTGAITKSSVAYKLLFNELSHVNYWLGSASVETSAGYARFLFRVVFANRVTDNYIYESSGIYIEQCAGVRPIVCLSSGVWIDNTDTTKDGSTKAKAWNLK